MKFNKNFLKLIIVLSLFCFTGKHNLTAKETRDVALLKCSISGFSDAERDSIIHKIDFYLQKEGDLLKFITNDNSSVKVKEICLNYDSLMTEDEYFKATKSLKVDAVFVYSLTKNDSTVIVSWARYDCDQKTKVGVDPQNISYNDLIRIDLQRIIRDSCIGITKCRNYVPLVVALGGGIIGGVIITIIAVDGEFRSLPEPPVINLPIQ